jgi:exodeoxyribonuclease V beta subunit
VLQYHLYLLALHRYLRTRLPDYDYDRDIGGVRYLFVRGMAPQYGADRGVFADRPTRALMDDLDALFGSPT